jgi:hypothetical protein
MKKVTAFQGYGIFASYDAEAPDTADQIFVATEELAQQVCAELNCDPRAHNGLAYVEGCEHCEQARCRSEATHFTRRIDNGSDGTWAWCDEHWHNGRILPTASLPRSSGQLPIGVQEITRDEWLLAQVHES